MTRNTIIEGIYKDSQYLDYCKKVCGTGDLYQDLFQYVVLYLMEMSEGKLEALFESGNLKIYVARMIYLSVNSERGMFRRQYRSVGDDLTKEAIILAEDENNEFDTWMNQFDIELQKECNRCIIQGVYPAQVKMYELYEEKRSYTEVAKCTRIPYKTVQRNIKQLREKIIKTINDKDTTCNAG